MPRLTYICLLLAFYSATARSALDVRKVAPGDAEGLIAELHAALAREGRTIIQLSAGSEYVVGEPLLPFAARAPGVESTVEIIGQGANILVSSPFQEAIWLSPEDGLDVRDVTFTVIAPQHGTDPASIAPFDLRGGMYWENVTISDSRLRTFSLGNLVSLGYQGTQPQVWRNVTVSGSQIQGRSAAALGLVYVLGEHVRLEHVTIVGNSAADTSRSVPIALGRNGGDSPPARVANSIIEACYEPIQSEGGNVLLDAGCEAGASDRVVVSAKTIALADNGGLVPTVATLPDSPAVGGGALGSCIATDARGFRRSGRCDAGAYQFAAGAAGGKLSAGGLNGTWYDAGGPGVLLVNRNNDEHVLFVWLTVDEAGIQRWVHGVLELDFPEASGTAYSNRIVAGVPTAHVVGTFEARFLDCGAMEFSLASTDHGTPSVAVELSRLSIVSQLGCEL